MSLSIKPYQQAIAIILLFAGDVMRAVPAWAQVYIPVPVSGFNNDAFAESGASAMAVTTTALDLSDYILYTQNFAAANSIIGGVVNNGTIVNGSRTYQLADYTGNNVLYLSANGTGVNTAAGGTLTLQTPASFSKISLLLFSTEGNSMVQVTLGFTDGTTVTMANATILDWFGGVNAVYTSMGRVTRLTAGPYTAYGISTGDPRFYPLDIAIACANQGKLLQTVTINFITGTLPAARAVVLALSGVAYTPIAITSAINPAICGGAKGSIALTTTGGSTPLTYSWNTSPVQTTAAATGLPAGNYTCTITDVNGCVTTHQDTITQQSVVVLKPTARPTAVCAGEAVALSVTASGGTLTSYDWAPGNQSGGSVTVNPVANTTYTVSGQDAFGCTASATVAVTVKPIPDAFFTVTPAAACLGTVQTVAFTGHAGSTATYDWNNFNGAAVQSGTSAGPYNIVFGTAGAHTLTLKITDDGCSSPVSSQAVTITAPPVVSFSVDKTTICAGSTITVTFTGKAGNTAVVNWNWGGGILQYGSGAGPYTIKYNNNGLITCTIKDGACSAVTASASIAVIPQPMAAFTASITKGCAPLAVQFTNQSQQADTYTWDFGDGATTTANNPAHIYQVTGDFTVQLTATAQGQCVNTKTNAGLIIVRPAPVASFTTVPGMNTPVELSQAGFTFNNTSTNADSYSWRFGDGETATSISPVHQYMLPGAYSVSLYAYSDAGCADSITLGMINLIPDKIVLVPNAFSPNGDGVNDRWEINGLRAYPNCQVQVFNRWGQAVFTSRGYAIPWDGTYHSAPVPIGTYYYVIKNTRGTEMYSGWVEILR